jgi:hypothetical protein
VINACRIRGFSYNSDVLISLILLSLPIPKKSPVGSEMNNFHMEVLFIVWGQSPPFFITLPHPAWL